MSNKIERYLRKKVFSKNDRIAIILYKYKEIKKFLELCKKYNIFTDERFMVWRSGRPFIEKYYEVFQYQDGPNNHNPAREEFEGNLVVSGAITNRDSYHLNLIWSYTSSFFDTERRISKDEYDYQSECTKVITLNEFEEIIKKVLNIKTSKQNQKIKNLKI